MSRSGSGQPIPRRRAAALAVATAAGTLALLGVGVDGAAAFPGRDSITYAGVPLPAGLIARTHESITGNAVAAIASGRFGASTSTPAAAAALERIVAANAAVDDDQTHAALHFDGESFPEGQARVLALRSGVVGALRANDLTRARDGLGSALHTVQDFYSHSNWVELGSTAPNPDLGRPGRTMTRPGPGVVTCSGSNLVTDQLTSGYYAGEDRVATPGKCRHGGLLDAGSRLEGINKDTRLAVLSPHAFGHEQAATLATQASRQFIEGLVPDVTDAQLRALLGLA